MAIRPVKSRTYIFPKLFSAEECSLLKTHCLQQRLSPAVVGYGERSRSDEALRKSTVLFLDLRSDVGKVVGDRVRLAMLDANMNCFGLRLSGMPWLDLALQFTEYDSAQGGKYGWHEDNHWLGEGEDRKLSLVVQLTERSEYEGGELEVEGTGIDRDKFGPVGSAIVFPAHFRHRVVEVTNGVRHSLVGWARGPRLS